VSVNDYAQKNYAYLKISEGVIDLVVFVPFAYARRKRFAKPLKIGKRIEGLAKNGVKELILIAQDLTYYGIRYKEKST
jgi:ribosomal protein S12 methylthiotransferase